MFSIENVVRNRFPRLPKSSPKTYGTLVTLLRFIFKESEFQSFAQRYPNLKGFDFVEQVLEHFGFGITVSDRERERIPAWGKVVIIANHPIGSLDGLALLKMVGQVRRDVKVVANDMLSYLEPLHSLLLPVDNMGNATRRDNIRAIEQHLQAEGALIIFPAGEVSRIGPRGVRDGKWQQGFLRFAVKSQAPILPVCIDAHNSVFFYGLSMIAKPISTLWLVREMFKHTNNTVRVHIGQSIAFETYRQLPNDTPLRTKLFRRHVYKVGKGDSAACFKSSMDCIAHPEDRQTLRHALRQCELLGTTKDGLRIHLFQYQEDSPIMRELGRLREISFRAVGEGSGRRRDIDAFDRVYDHIVLWDDDALEIVGAYRLRRITNPTHDAAAAAPRSVDEQMTGFYSHTLFEYRPEAQAYTAQGVELGRSFVQPRYWRQNGLDLLWRGIGAYLNKYPEIRYMFGPVSISNRLPPHARDLLVSFYRNYFAAPTPWAVARTPYQSDPATGVPDWSRMEYRDGLVTLKTALANMGLSIPPLYKQYTELCEPGGVHFVDFNIDASFAHCIDGLVSVDLQKVKASRKKRYLGE
ncbi:GNAT family N-acetyltransferase [Corticibacter populi]|uniref:L-ornithine N(alpha)-acyltransferase n=1 Tax=Corticibacter populi TaxID=1550736 RepID=A0A3M6QM31_9BURK|nr:lysophospholipid acyltransferase family protein [Corticibacter populi]RMX04094.1 GNAT family N-acetyltransferase [Corticibacter populi]RZS33102.1 putative hemolysin [Corticibacter populi]